MSEVKLPKISEDHDESSIVLWFKQEGDAVTTGDVLVEVQTEKAVSEIEADTDGILEKILIKRGETANVGDVLCIIRTRFESSMQNEKETGPEASSRKERGQNSSQKAFVRVAPRLRKLAKDLDVDLTQIEGTGRSGKITEDDIKNAAGSQSSNERFGQALEGMRRTIADRMKDSLQNTAQLTETAYADVTALAEKRAAYDTKLSWNTWIIYQTIKALKEHPYMNGTYDNGLLNQSETVNLGVATDTDDGLLVPVIKDAGQYSIEQLHEAINNVAELARSKKLSTEQMSGSTFTITNLGSFGVHFFTPIINPPEIAILGIGKIEDYLFRKQGKIADGKRLPLSLTFDHQVVDGAPAARFLKTLIAYLEAPHIP
ncbi:pyruvate dehydrogenase E2 component (dihydrolipoamide acetyltransferase) [Lentibacillus persicus]|uniref:Dihydrolipoamide acetyltransferase component of pyruvate dehydrogenase complex n=1 Tax=Lentibacillus persicus TaxID=640948 RepID=A0A1I1W8G4_9BACI|nr:dihydrolipoamide acetyltransferase family protein [Lentibacillus persicus]SFD89300.1 pyruvate dehydrogenase E2 component (dihydrolipoamide acetyltransferase) [Lentibacillus persicus]